MEKENCKPDRFSEPERARSSAGERCVDIAEVTGSIPVAPTIRKLPAAYRAPRLLDDLSDSDHKLYVYAIACGPFHKVGISRNIQQRMSEMELMNPYEPRLALYRTVPRRSARFVEARMHELLAASFHRREWFTASIEEIRAAAKLAMTEAQKRDRVEQSIRAEWDATARLIVREAHANHTPPDLRSCAVRRRQKAICAAPSLSPALFLEGGE
jgi:hypothetical protein